MQKGTQMRPVRHFIGGEFVAGANNRWFDNVNPATDEVIAQISEGGESEIQSAVHCAEQALVDPAWAQITRSERAQILRRVGDMILAKRHELATLESQDTGKPYHETFNSDILRAVKNFHFFVDLLMTESQATYLGDDGSQHTSYREPLGVVGLITPWNLPLYLATWKLAPALAMGNAVVLKPAEWTPMTANALAEIFQEARVPAGVLNVVHGFGPQGAGEALVRHPRVRAISFTGETGTGRAIMAAAAPNLKKLSFELGGKGASVVFHDCNWQEAVKTVTHAAFRNQGQICLAGSRLIVQESISERFIEAVLSEMKTIKVGDPLHPDTRMGALIHKEHLKRVEAYVEGARKSSAEVLAGGRRPAHLHQGAFYEPTLVTRLRQDDALIQEEVFGPVLSVQTFRSLDEALALTNGTPYGLSCSVWSESRQTTQAFSKRARMGLVWVNAWFLRNLHCPFGGMKSSGIGREGGEHSFNFYSEYKTVSYKD